MLVSDFDYDLPDELIAQEPCERGRSRLLVLDRASSVTRHCTVADLPGLLRAGDLLVVNDTRVFSARLLGHRVPSGGAVECLLLERVSDSAGTSEQTWLALVHPGQKLKPGARLRFEGPAGVLEGEVLAQHYYGRRTICLEAPDGGSIDDLVDALGHVPLPPYIKRGDTAADRKRYQTVFARARGSIAAPTAGLHFTSELLDELSARGIERAPLTLHVGYGTFKPVRAERVEDHTVDPERYDTPARTAAAINRAKAERRRVIGVGTTTTRALEDAAIRGGGTVVDGPGTASFFIYPGFRFQVIDALLTNFHLPRSSLVMLVSAFAGRERVLAAYRDAVNQRYRFYSYGDAMLIL